MLFAGDATVFHLQELSASDGVEDSKAQVAKMLNTHALRTRLQARVQPLAQTATLSFTCKFSLLKTEAKPLSHIRQDAQHQCSQDATAARSAKIRLEQELVPSMSTLLQV
ncbi:unnamed protein product [Sympodiomycopsis kandeliae]